MANILVAGNYDEAAERALAECRAGLPGTHSGIRDAGINAQRTRELARQIGKAIIAKNHTLYGCAETLLDRFVAEGAQEALGMPSNLKTSRIVSYICRNAKPSHEIGDFIYSDAATWSKLEANYSFPEAIKNADAVILLGDNEHVQIITFWSQVAGKPLLPITSFAMHHNTSRTNDIHEIFKHEMRSFVDKYNDRINTYEYEILKKAFPLSSSDTDTSVNISIISQFAEEIIELAGKIVMPNKAFIIMPFSDDLSFTSIYDIFVDVAKNEFGFGAFRLDRSGSAVDHIIPEVYDNIRKSAFVIVDVSEPRPNVYYELGFARGLGKNVILTARKGTDLPFDITDFTLISWSGDKDAFRRNIRERISLIKKRI